MHYARPRITVQKKVIMEGASQIKAGNYGLQVPIKDVIVVNSDYSNIEFLTNHRQKVRKVSKLLRVSIVQLQTAPTKIVHDFIC